MQGRRSSARRPVRRMPQGLRRQHVCADLARDAVRLARATRVTESKAGFRTRMLAPQIRRSPERVAVDGAGNVYFSVISNNRIRKVAPDGTTTTLAGNGTLGFADGTGGPDGTAELAEPTGVAVDGAGNVYVADFVNARIRKVA